MTWQLDPAHSSVTFSAKHMMVTTVRGTLGIADTSLAIDERHPERARVRVTLDAASIDTGVAPRDQHLRSADFLDAETYPQLIFTSTRVELTGDDSFNLHGELTIRGVTRPVVLASEFHGIVPNLQGGRRAAFSAATEIDREDWGLTWNVGLESGGWLVSKQLKIEIDLAVVQAESTASASEVAADETEKVVAEVATS